MADMNQVAIPSKHGQLPSRSAILSLEETRQSMSDYIGQLVHGCEHSQCREVLCHTGRCNVATNGKPVRKYTPRSARVIALSVCSGPQPQSHRCLYYQSWDEPMNSKLPRDPSSLTQLLADTSSVEKLINPSKRLASPEIELDFMHKVVDNLRDAAAQGPTKARGKFLSNNALAHASVPVFSWLLSKCPLQRLSPWLMVHRQVISKGLAYPQKQWNVPADESFNNWLVILDLLNHEPYLRFLERIASILGRRRHLEYALASAAKQGGHKRRASQRSIGTDFVGALHSCGHSKSRLYVLLVWLTRLFAKIWDGAAIVRLGSATYGVLEMLHGVFVHVESLSTKPDSKEFWIMDLVPRRISATEMCEKWVAQHDQSEPHLLNWNFMFNERDLVLYFRTMNHLKMREAHAESEKSNLLRRRNHPLSSTSIQMQHMEDYYLLLNVSRGNVLEDALDQLWQRREGELRRPLRVRLGEVNDMEVGHDLGGVQIEFFNLICRHAFQEELGMFTTDPQTGYSYFRPGSLQPLHKFELLGVLFSLAIYNGVALPINFPTVFYHVLKGDLDDLSARLMDTAIMSIKEIKDGWPTIAQSLRYILASDIDDLDFTFPLEANGLLLQIAGRPQSRSKSSIAEKASQTVSEAVLVDSSAVEIAPDSIMWPGWEFHKEATDQQAEPVTQANKSEYVLEYMRWLIYGQVQPQWTAFLKGFNASQAWEGNKMSFLTPTQFKHIVEGSSTLDISDLRRAAQYDNYSPQSKYIDWFWRIVTAWPEKRQRELLKFVTAAERIPITGASSLTFIIKKTEPDNLEALPTSSTCFGTLMLPRYPSQAMLAAKLELALKHGAEGFGTG